MVESCDTFKSNTMVICRMAPEVIACDENPDSTYDCKVSSENTEYQCCMSM